MPYSVISSRISFLAQKDEITPNNRIFVFFCILSITFRSDSALHSTHAPLFYEQLKRTTHMLQQGDLIFTRGRGFFSHYFAKTSVYDQRFSHVGIVVFDHKHHFGVRHALADEITGKGFVQTDSLETFLADSQYWAVYRLLLPMPLREKMIAFSEQLERNHTPFDYEFNLNDAGRAVYCTELIWYSVKQTAHLDLLSKNYKNNTKNKIIPIDSLYLNSYVTLVENFRVN